MVSELVQITVTSMKPHPVEKIRVSVVARTLATARELARLTISTLRPPARMTVQNVLTRTTVTEVVRVATTASWLWVHLAEMVHRNVQVRTHATARAYVKLITLMKTCNATIRTPAHTQILATGKESAQVSHILVILVFVKSPPHAIAWAAATSFSRLSARIATKNKAVRSDAMKDNVWMP